VSELDTGPEVAEFAVMEGETALFVGSPKGREFKAEIAISFLARLVSHFPLANAHD